MKISRWPPIVLKFNFFTHGCQLDVIKVSNYSFLGKQNSNIRNRNVLLIKQIGSSDILIIHCNKRLVGLIVQPFIFRFLVKVKLGQVPVGLENVKTHSSSLVEELSIHYYAKII